MTQLELADRLNISYQAISNWERGISMPDLSNLSELSELWDVSIDEILGNSRAGKILSSISEQRTEEITPQELEKAAPFLKPDQLEQSCDNMKDCLTMQDLVQLAPFISSKLLNESILNAASKGFEIKDLVYLAPFSDSKIIASLLQEYLEKGGTVTYDELIKIIPFLNHKTADYALQTIENDKIGISQLKNITPFVGTDTVSRILERIIDSGRKLNRSDLNYFAPFLNNEAMEKAFRSVFQ